MLLIELARLSSQHRTLYFVLILWIILLIAGMYKYMPGNASIYLRRVASSSSAAAVALNADAADLHRSNDLDVQRHQQHGSNAPSDRNDAATFAECGHIDAIRPHEDGGLYDDWQLLGVLLLIRHGDRGPMVHVRGVNGINCGISTSSTSTNGATATSAAAAAVEQYRSFLTNFTAAGCARPTWNKPGPFHGNPLLPALSTTCMLGQLTYKGIAQLLQTGHTLRQVYGAQLSLYTYPPQSTAASNTSPKMTATAGNGNNSGGHSASSPSASMSTTGQQSVAAIDDGLIEIYSTRYRRTFQSVMALMFGLVPAERWRTLTVLESHSIAFCFDDCVCPQVGRLQKRLLTHAAREAATAAANAAGGATANNTSAGWKLALNVTATLDHIGDTLLENPSMAPGHAHPMEVRDAVLAVLCHGQTVMPCRMPGDDDRMAGVVVTAAAAAAAATPGAGSVGVGGDMDFINIDQDEQDGGGGGGGVSIAGGSGSSSTLYNLHQKHLQQLQHQQQRERRERQNLAYETRRRPQQQSSIPSAAAYASSIFQQPTSQSNNDDNDNEPTNTENADANAPQCIRHEHIAQLLAHTRRLRQAEQRHPDHRNQGLLRAYGLLRHIVAQVLRMLSGHRMRLVVYAGHDRTLEFLLAALGVHTDWDPFVPYAARLAIEVYRSRTNADHYVRFVYQGRDVTRLVEVCAGGRSLSVRRSSRRGGHAALCPLENIIRFVHDDYFGPFNATNFREACQTTSAMGGGGG